MIKCQREKRNGCTLQRLILVNSWRVKRKGCILLREMIKPEGEENGCIRKRVMIKPED
jgi:hypothetical protein